MNFLTPLYLLGALAIVAPIVFHLIRQTPRGEIPFSSIMFLEPSPPRVTQRSRIDHWLLLLLRAGVLAMLALAFARPFWRAVAQVDPGDATARRTLVLLDTSASMRRGDLWAEAKKKAEAAIAAARPVDPLAIFAFDTAPRTILSFAEAAQLEPPARLALARSRVAALEPTWRATDLGAALAEAVAAIADGADRDAKVGRVPRRIVLISDLQAGARVEALGNFAWPADVELDLQTVALVAGNAGIEALADAEPAAPGPAGGIARPIAPADGPAARVRVSNDPASRVESFRVGWLAPRGGNLEASVNAYVPPGESRVIRVPLPPVDPKLNPSQAPPSTLRLDGDPFVFDNSVYVATARQAEEVVAFYGDDAPDDPNGLLYYLNRVFESTPRRTVRVVVRPAAPDPKARPGLVVIASQVAPDRAEEVRRQVTAGTSALVVATRGGPAPTLATLLGLPAVEWVDAPAGRDAMLGQIAFDHPLFAPLAGPQFNDFTKIRFWKHRKATDADRAFAAGKILARFDDGDPAIVEIPVGEGRVVVFTSGWSPSDSQLARSSKFVPLMASLLDRRGGPSGDPPRYRIGDRVALVDLGFPAPGGPAVEVRQPDGKVIPLEPGTATFAATDAPGVYSARPIGPDAGPPRLFAVNLDPSESRTAPLGREVLQQLGAKLAGDAERARLDAEALRQMQTAELEGRQKLWRWLVLAAIALLIGETWLAGRVDRSRHTRPASVLGT